MRKTKALILVVSLFALFFIFTEEAFGRAVTCNVTVTNTENQPIQGVSITLRRHYKLGSGVDNCGGDPVDGWVNFGKTNENGIASRTFDPWPPDYDGGGQIYECLIEQMLFVKYGFYFPVTHFLGDSLNCQDIHIQMTPRSSQGGWECTTSQNCQFKDTGGAFENLEDCEAVCGQWKCVDNKQCYPCIPGDSPAECSYRSQSMCNSYCGQSKGCNQCGCPIDDNSLCSNCNPECQECITPGGTYDEGGSWTSFGCINTGDPAKFVSWLLRWAMGVGGGIALILAIAGGLQIITSSGDPEKLKAGRTMITSAIAGLLLIIFSVFLLQLIGGNILEIPELQ